MVNSLANAFLKKTFVTLFFFFKSLSHVFATYDFVTLCDPTDSSLHQAPLSMGFSRQEYWSGLPFPSPGNLPDLGIEPRSPALIATLPSEPPEVLGSLKTLVLLGLR